MSNVTTVQECMYNDRQSNQAGTTAKCTCEGDIYNSDNGQCPAKTDYGTLKQNSCSRREWRCVRSVNISLRRDTLYDRIISFINFNAQLFIH